MANYTKTTNFTAKDALASGDPNKVAKGSDVDTEFDNIATASATKTDKIGSPVLNDLVLQDSTGNLKAAGYGMPNVNADITASDEELNKMDGVTATTAELNYVDVTAGTATASKAVVLDASSKINTLDITSPKINGSSVTATAAELNKMDGCTATTTEINRIADGITATASEVNAICDGKTLTSSDDKIDNFPAGTKMLFQQTSAPTGWTKQTTHNNKALRVVSGTATSGGTESFSSRLNSTSSTAPHTLSISEIPAHTHTNQTYNTVGAGGEYYPGYGTPAETITSSSTGGGGSHSHNLVFDIQYVDIIIASKD